MSGQGAPVDYHVWVTGRPQQLPPAHRSPAPKEVWETLPGAWHNDYQLAGSSIEHSQRGQDNWHFNEVGQGAMRFTATNAGGGLVISLTAWNHSDLNGYFVVLDDDNHDSYVMKISALGSNRLSRGRMDGGQMTGQRSYTKVSGVSVDPSFRLDSGVPQKIWLMYRQGAISVGRGDNPGQGLVLHMSPEPNRNRQRGTDLYHFAFARYGKRWPHPIRISGAQSLKYKMGAIMPMPTNSLSGKTADDFPPPMDPARVLYRGDADAFGAAVGGKRDKGPYNDTNVPERTLIPRGGFAM